MTAEHFDWTNGVLIYRRKKLGPFSEPARLTIGRNSGLCSNPFPVSALCFQTSRKVLPLIDLPNFEGVAVLPVFRASAFILIAIHGPSERKHAAIHSVSLKKRWVTAVAQCTKHTPAARSSSVRL